MYGMVALLGTYAAGEYLASGEPTRLIWGSRGKVNIMLALIKLSPPKYFCSISKKV